MMHGLVDQEELRERQLFWIRTEEHEVYQCLHYGKQQQKKLVGRRQKLYSAVVLFGFFLSYVMGHVQR